MAEVSSNETWRRGLILSGHSGGCAHGDKLVCSQPPQVQKTQVQGHSYDPPHTRLQKALEDAFLVLITEISAYGSGWTSNISEAPFSSFVLPLWARRCWLTTLLLMNNNIVIIGQPDLGNVNFFHAINRVSVHYSAPGVESQPCSATLPGIS